MEEARYSESDSRIRRTIWFGIWNLLAFGVMFGLFLAVRDIEWWDGGFQACFRFFYRHETLAVMAAMLPFFASLLVGWGYARRARQRRLRSHTV